MMQEEQTAYRLVGGVLRLRALETKRLLAQGVYGFIDESTACNEAPPTRQPLTNSHRPCDTYSLR